MRGERRTIGRGDCSGPVQRSSKILPAHTGVGRVSPLSTGVLCNSNGYFYSYLGELCRIAITSKLLSSDALERLKEKKVLVGSRRIRREKSDKATDLSDDEAWNLEYDLLTPDQVVIADDMITFQQFGEDLFCAPQEDILEGKYNSTHPAVAYAHP